MQLTKEVKPRAVWEAVWAIRGRTDVKELHPAAIYNAFVESYNHVAKLMKITLTPAMFAALVSLRMDMGGEAFRLSGLRKLAQTDPLSLSIGEEFVKLGRKIGKPIRRAAERSLYYRGIIREI